MRWQNLVQLKYYMYITFVRIDYVFVFSGKKLINFAISFNYKGITPSMSHFHVIFQHAMKSQLHVNIKIDSHIVYKK